MDKRINIIFDTDIEAHLCNKVRLLGVVADSINSYAAPCCEMIAKYYGVTVPIGTTFSYHFETANNKERFADYIKHSQNCFTVGKSYNYSFAKEIEKSDSDYPSATSVYRELLAKAEDNSVTVLGADFAALFSRDIFILYFIVFNLKRG